jgi:hypothetical protein
MLPIIVRSEERVFSATGLYKSTISARDGAKLTLMASDSSDTKVDVNDSLINANYTDRALGSMYLQGKSNARIFSGGASSVGVHLYDSSVADVILEGRACASIYCHKHSRANIVSTGESKLWITASKESFVKVAASGEARLDLMVFDCAQLEGAFSGRSNISIDARNYSTVSITSLQSSLADLRLYESARLFVSGLSTNPANVILGWKSHLYSKGLVTVGVMENSKVTINCRVFSTIKESASSGI